MESMDSFRIEAKSPQDSNQAGIDNIIKPKALNISKAFGLYFHSKTLLKMRIQSIWIVIVLLFGLTSCTSSPAIQDIDIFTGHIKKIEINFGGWGLQTDNELYELVELPKEYKVDGLHVRMGVKHLDQYSILQVGPIVEVLEVERVD